MHKKARLLGGVLVLSILLNLSSTCIAAENPRDKHRALLNELGVPNEIIDIMPFSDIEALVANAEQTIISANLYLFPVVFSFSQLLSAALCPAYFR